MMTDKTKGILIDFIILIILMFIIMFGIWVLYDIFPNLSRLVCMLIIFVMIPIFWGTIIFSLKSKNTLGHIIIKKMKK